MPVFKTLADWLAWQETLHPEEIELGLERIQKVYQRLQTSPFSVPVITVAGTNGKGSSIAMLSAIYQQQGYRTGSYTSPHLLRYNERIRIQGQPVTDQTLCDAFERVEQARQTESLTYFEFGTLAALDIFHRHELDVILLETGLGGRLDAVNIVDTDAALITTIDLDHQQWLGHDREAIGREKAGIFRSGKPAICADTSPPASLRAEADRAGAYWLAAGSDFFSHIEADRWHWHGITEEYCDLPMPALPGDHQLHNAAGVLMVIEQLSEQLPVMRDAIHRGLQSVTLAGRLQHMPGDVDIILDVSHNTQGIAALIAWLEKEPCSGQSIAIFGMMADKDLAAVIAQLAGTIDIWITVDLQMPRAASAANLCEKVNAVAVNTACHVCENMAAACRLAENASRPGDRVIICGSFYTVAEWLASGGS
jgi:dihydrofolate synthase/folylpolyglutamate synthase